MEAIREEKMKIDIIHRKSSGFDDVLFALFLLIYPMRHVLTGLDFWDTGYNYANFLYMGTEHMDPMWLFSTYLSTAAGHLFTLLPYGTTLVGLNVYTGLTVSLIALVAYGFCRKQLELSPAVTFGGLVLAESLCWCPTALLYNYLTYFLLLVCVCLLFKGLTAEKKSCLVLAGICLGLNVFVRFSNLPEAALILAVWFYDLVVWMEWRKEIKAEKYYGSDADVRRQKAPFGMCLSQMLSHTGWCLLGYLAAVAVMLGFISVKYGFSEYTSGIARLFAMTDTAGDYTPLSMVMGIVNAFREQLYWAVRVVFVVVMGMFMYPIAYFCRTKLHTSLLAKLSTILVFLGTMGVLFLAELKEWLPQLLALRTNPQFMKYAGFAAVVLVLMLLWARLQWNFFAERLSLLMAVCTVAWLYHRGFCSFLFYSYDSILRPGILFLMLFLFIALVRILLPRVSSEEKLLSALLVIQVMISAIGSNNGIYPSLNNLFLAAPYVLWELGKLNRIKHVTGRLENIVSSAPARYMCGMFLLLCAVQFCGFGYKFVFAEATGVQNADTVIENNEVLTWVKMPAEKANWMKATSDYVKREGLAGSEVILYGDIPALSFYLGMPSAFNPWSSLDSYSLEAMQEAITGLQQERPAIILIHGYSRLYEGGRSALAGEEENEAVVEKMANDKKFAELASFMKERKYKKSFSTELFVIYR